MSQFTNFNTTLKLELLVEESKKKKITIYKVIDSFEYYSKVIIPSVKLGVKVNKGFISDGATIPRIFWTLLPPMGEYGQASVLHDFLLDNRKIYYYNFNNELDFNSPIVISRRQCDQIFKEAMKVLGVSLFKRNVMYFGVRFWSIFKYIIKGDK